MSEPSQTCGRFDPVFLTGEPTGSAESTERSAAHNEWAAHLRECDDCRAQQQAHEMLMAAFGAIEAPELSAGFQPELDRKIASTLEVRPLRGWGRAAMAAYAVLALTILGWFLRDVPLPTIDPASPWVPVAAFVAVPLTFLLAIGASRWLPAGGPKLGSLRVLAA